MQQSIDTINGWIEAAKGMIARITVISLFIVTRQDRSTLRAFQKARIRAYFGNNRVLSGIEAVATLMQNDLFLIVYDECPRFREEIFKYIWKKNSAEPLKEMDDVLCAIRVRDLLRYDCQHQSRAGQADGSSEETERNDLVWIK